MNRGTRPRFPRSQGRAAPRLRLVAGRLADGPGAAAPDAKQLGRDAAARWDGWDAEVKNGGITLNIMGYSRNIWESQEYIEYCIINNIIMGIE